MSMAKDCGADMVKFQKRTIDIVYSPEELAAPRESPWGTTNGDQKRGLELNYKEYRQINEYSKELGLPWFASAWDNGSLDFLEQFNPPCHKVASAMITNYPFLETVARQKKLTYISTGLLPDFRAIDKAVTCFHYHECPFVIMHCVGEYPCPPGNTNLSMIQTLKERYPGERVGFSSHAVSPVIGALAVIWGAIAIEAHITLDRSMYGSDQAASLERPGLQKLVDYCRIAESARGHGAKFMTQTEAKIAEKLRWFERA